MSSPRKQTYSVRLFTPTLITFWALSGRVSTGGFAGSSATIQIGAAAVPWISTRNHRFREYVPGPMQSIWPGVRAPMAAARSLPFSSSLLPGSWAREIFCVGTTSFHGGKYVVTPQGVPTPGFPSPAPPPPGGGFPPPPPPPPPPPHAARERPTRSRTIGRTTWRMTGSVSR